MNACFQVMKEQHLTIQKLVQERDLAREGMKAAMQRAREAVAIAVSSSRRPRSSSKLWAQRIEVLQRELELQQR